MIDCSKCPEPGSCCGPFQMKKGFIEEHKDKIQKKPEKIVSGSWFECALCDDVACVFLNRKTKKCAIYEDRPEICRLYGISKNIRIQCPWFKPSGNPRSEASRKQIQRWHKNNNPVLNERKLNEMEIRPC